MKNSITYLGEVDYGIDFYKQQVYLMDRYEIKASHAGCYLLNYEKENPTLFCGKCPRLVYCNEIDSVETLKRTLEEKANEILD